MKREIDSLTLNHPKVVQYIKSLEENNGYLEQKIEDMELEKRCGKGSMDFEEEEY